MEYTPKSDGRTADYLIIGFFAVAVCAFAVSSSGIPFRGLVQIAGLVSLTVCLYLAIRYRFTAFRYVVADDGGEEVFEVYRTQGRRSIAECRMSLSYLRLAEFYSSNRELKKALRGCTFYRYTASVAPKRVCLAVFDSGTDKPVGIVFEPNDAFFDFLCARLPERTVSGEDYI